MKNSYHDIVRGISKIRSLVKGEILFHPGQRADAVYKVLGGEVHLFRINDNGNKVLLYRALEDSYFAEASLNSDVYHCTAECVKASKIQIIDANKMHKLLGQDAEFSSKWVSILSSELRRQRTSVERLNIRSASERIKHYILTESDARGELQLQGSLSDLSDVLGLSRECLYRTLSKMEKSGELERNDQSLKIK